MIYFRIFIIPSSILAYYTVTTTQYYAHTYMHTYRIYTHIHTHQSTHNTSTHTHKHKQKNTAHKNVFIGVFSSLLPTHPPIHPWQSLEKVLVQNILFGLSPSLTDAIKSVPRWRFIQAAVPHVMHCAASLLYNRSVSQSVSRMRNACDTIIFRKEQGIKTLII